MPQPVVAPPPSLPAIPEETQQEGARWRFHRPSSEQVAAWFNSVPMDDGMKHEDYVGGVVIIPQQEKVKYQTERGIYERFEMTYTPYMQIGTRLGYFRRLAEFRGLRHVIKPAEVPRSDNPASAYFNANMPEGLWWHVVTQDNASVRYLCATYVVQFFEPTEYARVVNGQQAMPVLEGSGTKQVGGGADANGLMKAQTGAQGRAIGTAGILVIGTGIATAEDMMEFAAAPAPGPSAAMLPPTEVPAGDGPPQEAADPAERLAQLQSQALALQTRMQEETPDAWREFLTWWNERRQQEGWAQLDEVPEDALRGVLIRMEREHAKAKTGVSP